MKNLNIFKVKILFTIISIISFTKVYCQDINILEDYDSIQIDFNYSHSYELKKSLFKNYKNNNKWVHYFEGLTNDKISSMKFGTAISDSLSNYVEKFIKDKGFINFKAADFENIEGYGDDTWVSLYLYKNNETKIYNLIIDKPYEAYTQRMQDFLRFTNMLEKHHIVKRLYD